MTETAVESAVHSSVASGVASSVRSTVITGVESNVASAVATGVHTALEHLDVGTTIDAIVNPHLDVQTDTRNTQRTAKDAQGKADPKPSRRSRLR